MNADICKWNDKMLCACLLGPGPVWQCSVRRITRLSDSGRERGSGRQMRKRRRRNMDEDLKADMH